MISAPQTLAQNHTRQQQARGAAPTAQPQGGQTDCQAPGAGIQMRGGGAGAQQHRGDGSHGRAAGDADDQWIGEGIAEQRLEHGAGGGQQAANGKSADRPGQSHRLHDHAADRVGAAKQGTYGTALGRAEGPTMISAAKVPAAASSSRTTV